MTAPSLKVALLCDDGYSNYQTAIRGHIEAFSLHSRHRMAVINPRGLRHGIGLTLGSFDALIIHFSLWVIRPEYLPPWLRVAIRDFPGPKLMFVQDEYRMVDEEARVIAEMGIHVLYSVAEQEVWPRLYGVALAQGLRISRTLTGYVSEDLAALASPAIEDRPVHIGYRAREQMIWLGRLAQEKRDIALGTVERAGPEGLRTDISWRTEDTIFGEAWIPFLMRCKATLGTESGASIVDFAGDIPERVAAFRSAYPNASEEDLYRELLAPLDGAVTIRAIAPRVFEAAATRTALVLFPGAYNGIVRPWAHYLPLSKDFSNFQEIATRLRDDSFLTAMTGRAHADLVASGRYSYRSFMAGIDDDLDHEMVRLNRRPSVMALCPVRIWPWRLRAVRRIDRFLRQLEQGARRMVRAACLAFAGMGSPPVWHAFARLGWRRPQARRVLTDLARLRLIARGRLGDVVIDAELDGTKAVLTGRRGAEPARGWERVLAALENGVVTELSWKTALPEGQRPFLMDDSDYAFQSLRLDLSDGAVYALIRASRQ